MFCKLLGSETRITSISYSDLIFRVKKAATAFETAHAEGETSWRNRLRRANRRDADVLVVRADTPRENSNAIGDAARRKHVSAVTAFKYPAEHAERAAPMSSPF